MRSRPPRPARPLILLTLLAILAASALPALADPTLPAQPAAVLWNDADERSFTPAGERWIVPQQYRLVELNVPALQSLLAAAPLEGTPAAVESDLVLALPLPEGGFGRFRIVQSPVMAPELAAKFPEISTYAGQGLDDPTATTRLDWTSAGFHAIIFGLSGTVYIDPFSRNDTTHYISYYARDFVPSPDKRYVETLPFGADAEAMQAELAELVASGVLPPTGSELRTYRLAMAATGEYTAFHGGTVPLGLAAIVTSVNRVTGIYEREVAVRMTLVANNNQIVYTNSATDPYSNNSGTTMLGQNQSNLDAVIGSANYDIGHVFSTGGGGVASLAVVCRAGLKARGVTGSSAPVGDPFDVDYVAHEIGHQFGGNHSFNGNAGSCAGGNRNGSTAYEPGSGSTVMAYAGICGAQNLQPNSDDYFHGVNLDEIVAYSTVGSGNGCPAVAPTGNQAPLVTVAPGGFTIPSQTPFSLTGSASDPNGDALTYNWEEFDLGTAGAPNNPLNPPFFRSWPSVASPARTFPRLSDLVNNSTVIGEVLPNVTRALNFRLTVRDNRLGGGGVNSANVSFNVTTAAGPFAVTAPNTAVNWAGNSSQSVTWNVAGTTAAPVSCPTVDISLSTDGGFTYPIPLAVGVTNDGAQAVTAPNIATASARVRVACANNVFFDISNVNFTITPVTCFWADINCSCGVSSTTIDIADLVAVAEAWNQFQGTGLYTLAADVNCMASGGCDGANDIVDVGVLASMWETACPAQGR
ncbi:MAG: reprolysin-like metallopeptidase [Anaerolineae bacterium]